MGCIEKKENIRHLLIGNRSKSKPGTELHLIITRSHLNHFLSQTQNWITMFYVDPFEASSLRISICTKQVVRKQHYKLSDLPMAANLFEWVVCGLEIHGFEDEQGSAYLTLPTPLYQIDTEYGRRRIIMRCSGWQVEKGLQYLAKDKMYIMNHKPFCLNKPWRKWINRATLILLHVTTYISICERLPVGTRCWIVDWETRHLSHHCW